MKIQGTEYDRGDFAAEISARSEVRDIDPYLQLSEDDALRALELFGEILADALVKFGRVELHDIGVFSLQDRDPRSGTTPDGEPWQTPYRKKIVFNAAPSLASAVTDQIGTETY
jgi:nucleoid DNA-binding protein